MRKNEENAGEKDEKHSKPTHRKAHPTEKGDFRSKTHLRALEFPHTRHFWVFVKIETLALQILDLERHVVYGKETPEHTDQECLPFGRESPSILMPSRDCNFPIDPLRLLTAELKEKSHKKTHRPRN
jgi:hypothetical protein